MMTALAPSPDATEVHQLRTPMRLAAAGFVVFIAGAASTMAAASLFDPLLLVLAALINLVLMLSICAVTAMVLEVPNRHSSEGGGWRQRASRRTLQLAALYWTAAGTAFLLSPVLARL
jgi:hypothetical protein